MTAQQLKNSILQLAVQGKLVPQDPNDEPASVLLERITKERERLIKEKKIKNPKTTSRIFRRDGHYYESINEGELACIDELIPFDIPESWEWVKLGTLCFVVSGTSYNKGDVRKDGIRILRGGNIQEEMLFLQDSDVYVPHSYKDEEKNVKKGDIILVASTGSLTAIGKAAYIYKNYSDVQIGAFMRIVRPYSMEYAEYMGKFFTTDNYRSHIRSLVSGTNINNIKAEHLLTLMVPVPPIEEQHRILKRLEELSPKISEYAELHQKQEKQEAGFPALLKKSILQHAIQGKLVPQDPNDEPASVLLERIAKERAKMGKKAAKSMSRIERRDRGTFLISPDGSEEDITNEIPFDIPESWEWSQLGSLAELKSGTVQKDSETGILYVKVGDLGLSENEGEIVTSRQRAECAEKDIIPPYSIIFPKRGGAIYTNKKRYILSTKVCVDLNTMAVILPPVLFDYVKLWFELLDLGKIANGSAIPQINNVDIAPLLIPIPPIKEQIRICSAVSEMIQSMKFNA